MLGSATAYVIAWVVASCLLGILMERIIKRRDHLAWKETITDNVCPTCHRRKENHDRH